MRNTTVTNPVTKDLSVSASSKPNFWFIFLKRTKFARTLSMMFERDQLFVIWKILLKEIICGVVVKPMRSPIFKGHRIGIFFPKNEVPLWPFLLVWDRNAYCLKASNDSPGPFRLCMAWTYNNFLWNGDLKFLTTARSVSVCRSNSLLSWISLTLDL